GSPTITGTPTQTFTPGPGGCQAVIWTNTVFVTVTGNSIQKTSGTEGQWDAGAVSTQVINSGDGFVSVTADQVSGYSRMFGLSHGDTNQHYSDIDFAIWASGTGELYVYESGVQIGFVGNYNLNDVLKVAVEGGAVKYYNNSTLLYT